MIDDYFVCISEKEIYNPEKKRKESVREIGFWCFNPGVCFRDLASLHVRSIILTSGTLSPMSSFGDEL